LKDLFKHRNCPTLKAITIKKNKVTQIIHHLIITKFKKYINLIILLKLSIYFTKFNNNIKNSLKLIIIRLTIQI